VLVVTDHSEELKYLPLYTHANWDVYHKKLKFCCLIYISPPLACFGIKLKQIHAHSRYFLQEPSQYDPPDYLRLWFPSCLFPSSFALFFPMRITFLYPTHAPNFTTLIMSQKYSFLCPCYAVSNHPPLLPPSEGHMFSSAPYCRSPVEEQEKSYFRVS
jgi:hypothetical protein